MTTAQPSQGSTDTRVLYMALALGWSDWTVGFTIGLGQAPRQVTVRARDGQGLLAQITQAKRRFGLPPDAPVHCVYAAGRDGFWLHRCLQTHGVPNVVVDASSIEVHRRYRRSKTDKLDVQKLLTMLGRFVLGETRLWKVVRVPSVDDETLRQPHRALIALKEERIQHINRLQGILARLGLAAGMNGTFPERLPALRQWDGLPVPALLQERLLRACARWSLVQRQLQDVDHAEARMVRDDQRHRVAQGRTLRSVRGIGAQSAWLLVREVCGWREMRNRRERAALAGLTPTPYHSGQFQREQGIRKAGSTRLRWLMVELAWGWLSWPPDSHRSRWYQERFGQGSARLRQLGIVALARKLLLALWRLVAQGERPPGAILADWYRKVTGRCAKRRPVVAAVSVCLGGSARRRQ
jgi:transposase